MTETISFFNVFTRFYSVPHHSCTPFLGRARCWLALDSVAKPRDGNPTSLLFPNVGFWYHNLQDFSSCRRRVLLLEETHVLFCKEIHPWRRKERPLWFMVKYFPTTFDPGSSAALFRGTEPRPKPKMPLWSEFSEAIKKQSPRDKNRKNMFLHLSQLTGNHEGAKLFSLNHLGFRFSYQKRPKIMVKPFWSPHRGVSLGPTSRFGLQHCFGHARGTKFSGVGCFARDFKWELLSFF